MRLGGGGMGRAWVDNTSFPADLCQAAKLFPLLQVSHQWNRGSGINLVTDG